MRRKQMAILPLASALGALAGISGVPADAKPAPSVEPPSVSRATFVAKTEVPNTLVSTGEALLGFTVTDKQDGSVTAQHVSHASHASHASSRF